MKNENIIGISEDIILLNGQLLNDYYFNFYNEFYDRSSNSWKYLEKNDKFKNLIRTLENRCLTNFKKFQIFSLISHNFKAFKELIFESGILMEDEEIQSYILNVEVLTENIKNQIASEFVYEVYSKVSHFEFDLNDINDKLRGLENFMKRYESIDRKELSKCVDHVDNSEGW